MVLSSDFMVRLEKCKVFYNIMILKEINILTSNRLVKFVNKQNFCTKVITKKLTF